MIFCKGYQNKFEKCGGFWRNKIPRVLVITKIRCEKRNPPDFPPEVTGVLIFAGVTKKDYLNMSNFLPFFFKPPACCKFWWFFCLRLKNFFVAHTSIRIHFYLYRWNSVINSKRFYMLQFFAKVLLKSTPNMTEELATQNETTNLVFSQNSSILHWSGYFLAVFAGFVFATASIFIKEMSKRKVHHTTINLYAAYFGIPLCIVLSSVAFGLDYPKPKDLNLIYQYDFMWEILIAFSSALAGNLY